MSGRAIRASYEVFVHGLPWTVSRKELAQYCSQFGQVVNAVVPLSKETGSHKGYGFVTFRNKEAVANLTNANIHFIEGSFLHFDPRSKKERLAMGISRQIY